jgi:hypothetical protein
MHPITRRLVHFVCCCALLPAAGSAVSPGDGWELAREENGITVHTREVEGSAIREFRGERVIDAGLNRLMALLDDTGACVDWMYNCLDPRSLHRASLLDRYRYVANDVPFPATDREMILHIRIPQDAESRVTTVSLAGVRDEDLPAEARAALPPAGNRVRVAHAKGSFELTPLDDAHTRVVFRMHLDPAGSLPADVVNSQIVDNPFETLSRMGEVVRREKYGCFNPF